MRLPQVCAAARFILALGPRATAALRMPDDELRAALALAARRPDLARDPGLARVLPHLGGAAFLRSLIPPRVRPAPPAPPPVRLAPLSAAPDAHTDGVGGGAWSYSHAKRYGAHTVRKQCDADDAAAERARILNARERRWDDRRVPVSREPAVLPEPEPFVPDPDVIAAEAKRLRAERLATLRHGGKPAIVLRDPDLMPDPDWVQRLRKRMKK